MPVRGNPVPAAGFFVSPHDSSPTVGSLGKLILIEHHEELEGQLFFG
jgi:hypothetical protein